MSITTIDFLLFLTGLTIIYYSFPTVCQKYILVLGSLCFYFFFGWKALAILGMSIVIAYIGSAFLSSLISKFAKKLVLCSIVALETGMLVLLKYFSVFSRSLGLVLPVGISFYTLALLGYVFDVYHSKYPAEKKFINFVLFATYFPHIMQGPIARYDSFLIQIRRIEGEKQFNYERMCFGAQLMLWGYIKKLVIADRAGIFVDQVYSNSLNQNGTILFIASVLYSIQLYMDFSGCVDIALGISEIFGIELSKNFKQPYFAQSINDFWRRWHISLSSWFRDYVYIPLGGSRRGKVRRWTNVLIVFIISGFWHGVGLNFIIWGMLHGLYQVIGAMFQSVREKAEKCLSFLGEKGLVALRIILTFLLVDTAWIFFRIPNVQEVLIILYRIICRPSISVLVDGSLFTYGINGPQWIVLILFILVTFIIDLLHERGFLIRKIIAKQVLPFRWGVYLMGFVAVILFGVYGIGYDSNSFIYMNF